MQPFCIVSIATILGIVTGLYLNSIAFLFVLCINIFAILKFKGYFKKCMCVALICFIVFYIYIISLENKYEKIVNNYGNETIMMQGIVVSSGEQKNYKTQYELQVTKVYSENTNEVKTENFKVICNIKGRKEKINLNYGDEIIFETVFEPPDIQRNEGGFNYSIYLKTQKIAGKVTAESESIKQIAIKKGSTILRLINNLRNFFIEKIYYYLPNEQASLCAALILGDKSGLSTELEDNFHEASLSHMLAISGAHISYILLGITIFLENLKIHKRWSKAFVCVFLLFFMVLAGGSPSITRACIMVILNLIAQILFLKSNTYNNLGISAFLILLFNPYAILDIGLQLSFAGTIGIVTFVDIFNIRLKRKGQSEKNKEKKYSCVIFKLLIYVEQIVIMALAANIVIIPIMLYNYSTIYFTFIISNLLATPIMGVCLIIGMIFLLSFFIPPFAYGVSFILTPLLKLFINIAELSSQIPFAKLLVPTPKIWQIIIYYLIIIIIFFKDKIKQCYKKYNLPILKNINITYKKIIAVLSILIVLPYIFLLIPQNKLEINFVDVGQGDCMLITTPSNKKIIIDGGGSEFGAFDVGEKTVLPYLLNKSILSIDYMLFTHFDSDHCQGLLTILENISVKNVIIGEQGEESQNFNNFLQIISEKKVNIIKVKAGDKIVIDKYCELQILFPDTSLIKENILNNNSIVAKFIYGDFSMLLTGDIEKIAEEKIVSKYNNTNILKSTILKVAHHGSKSSSIQGFLEMVEPKIALIGVGAANSYGHPNADVIERLENLRLYGL